MKIMIIGSGGSGKSTFATKLGQLTNVPVIHLDAEYWHPGWTPTPNEEWDRKMYKMVRQQEWIMDGNFGRTLDIRLEAADVVIFLDFPPLMNLYRVVKRRLQFHGKSRPDMNEGCPEKLDWAFIKWVWSYRKKRRPGVLEKLAEYSADKRIIIVSRRKQLADILQAVRQKGLNFFNISR